MWEIKQIQKLPKMNKPVLIEGLPGIANVGKIAVDFLIECKKAKKIIELRSDSLPHAVFVKENNLVDLPKLDIYHYKNVNQDLLFLAGDFQPANEKNCYDFCRSLLKFLKDIGCKELVTTGGIGLPRPPRKPRVFCTANTKEIVERYRKKSKKLNDKSFGVIDSVVGVTGLLVGLAKEYDIEAIALLAETFAYPFYVGISGAREMLSVIDDNFSLKLDLKELDKEISNIEAELIELSKISQKVESKPDKDKASYIG